MNTDRTDEIKQDAMDFIVKITEKGYTIEEMMIATGYIDFLNKAIRDEIAEKATMREYLPNMAQLEHYL